MGDVDQYYTSRVLQSDDLLWQVGKTVNGKPVDKSQLALIVDQIKDELELQDLDHVIDLGCGNAILTKEIAPFVANIVGIERNRELYQQACKINDLSNLRLVNADMLDKQTFDKQLNKGYCYEVVQHLTHKELEQLVIKMKTTVPTGGSFFLGGIPDEERKWIFFDNVERKNSLSKNLLETGNDPVGTWFFRQFFVYLADKLAIHAVMLAQSPDLYTAHYRFDCLLRF